jgi:hypothetical protein
LPSDLSGCCHYKQKGESALSYALQATINGGEAFDFTLSPAPRGSVVFFEVPALFFTIGRGVTHSSLIYRIHKKNFGEAAEKATWVRMKVKIEQHGAWLCYAIREESAMHGPSRGQANFSQDFATRLIISCSKDRPGAKKLCITFQALPCEHFLV